MLNFTHETASMLAADTNKMPPVLQWLEIMHLLLKYINPLVWGISFCSSGDPNFGLCQHRDFFSNKYVA
jgi:hypothetical protein